MMSHDPNAVSDDHAPVPASSSTPRRSKRRWLWMLLGVSIGWKVLVFGVGSAVPRFMIDDGVAALPPELRPYGRHAMKIAGGLWNGPLERHGVRRIRLVSVDRTSVPNDSAGGATGCAGFAARVRAYTFFAIPYSEVRTVCDSGVVEYRVLRPRRSGQ